MLKLQSPSFDSVEWDNLFDRYISSVDKLKLEYIMTHCSRCIKKGNYRNKDCSLLKGFNQPVCTSMTNSIKMKLKNEEKELIHNLIEL